MASITAYSQAKRRHQWSWRLFGWIMLLALLLVLVSSAIPFVLAYAGWNIRANAGLVTALVIAVILLGVALITVAAVTMQRRYLPPDSRRADAPRTDRRRPFG